MPHKKDVGSQPAELLGGIKKYCTCHTKKGGGVPSDPWVQVTRTSRRHRTYSTCHTKRTWGHKVLLGGRVTSAPATQKESRVTIVANDLHLPHKKEVESQKMFGSIEKYCACHTKRTYRVTQNCSEARKEPATTRN